MPKYYKSVYSVTRMWTVLVSGVSLGMPTLKNPADDLNILKQIFFSFFSFLEFQTSLYYLPAVH